MPMADLYWPALPLLTLPLIAAGSVRYLPLLNTLVPVPGIATCGHYYMLFRIYCCLFHWYLVTTLRCHSQVVLDRLGLV